MKLHEDGLWIPDIMTGPAAYLRRASTLPAHCDRIRSHRCCIQAGGHIGIYPRYLAQRFGRVYTFEPERENFACLARNADAENIFAARAFLGDRHGGKALQRHSKSSGGHQITVAAAGAVPVFCIDDLALPDLDGLFLDVEGYEWWILRGAMRTLDKCRPLLVLEENRQLVKFGRAFGDLEKLLAPLGYRLIERVDEDIVLQAVKRP